MKLIKPTVEIVEQKFIDGINDMLKHIELCGRVSYKSEDKITKNSALEFIAARLKDGHLSIMEQGTVYLRYDFKAGEDSNTIAYRLWDKYNSNPYSVAVQAQPVPGVPNGFVAITTNYRVLLENNWTDDLDFICSPTEFHVKRITVKFICDRAIANEFVRHRVFSFVQESTRFCNYSKNKFNNEIQCIIPCWTSNLIENNSYDSSLLSDYDLTITESMSQEEVLWIWSMCAAEDIYLRLLKEGAQPQQARTVLPLALKTELIMTGTVPQWEEFFKLRCAANAHPQARELADMLKDKFKELCIL